MMGWIRSTGLKNLSTPTRQPKASSWFH